MRRSSSRQNAGADFPWWETMARAGIPRRIRKAESHGPETGRLQNTEAQSQGRLGGSIEQVG